MYKHREEKKLRHPNVCKKTLTERTKHVSQHDRAITLEYKSASKKELFYILKRNNLQQTLHIRINFI